MKYVFTAIFLLAGLMHQVAQAASDRPGALAAPRPAQLAAPNLPRAPAQNVIAIDAGSGRVIQLGGSAATVFAADPKVAEVRPASATSLFIFGVAPGRTTVAALNASGGPIAQFDVVVRPSSYGANEAETAVARALPGSSVHVETLQNGLTITGQVKTPSDADRVMQIVRGYLPSGQSVDNRPLHSNMRHHQAT